MGFKRTEANKLLVACHRRCCVCHRYCGIKIELHHIQPNEDGGDDSIENAIPLCFECHAEVQLYNDAHPRGRKFHPDELQDHKGQWLRICEESPGALLMPQRPYDVGPIQALIDELEFNAEISKLTDDDTIGALFLVTQFERSISEGLFSLLPDQVRRPISATYATLMRANMYLTKMATMPWGGSGSAWHQAYAFAMKAINRSQTEIPEAYEALLAHLGHKKEDADGIKGDGKKPPRLMPGVG
jgi:hypothetical protein